MRLLWIFLLASVFVPFAPGGVADSSARVISERLGARLGQPIVVENRPGASGNLGTAAVAAAAPDGYTGAARLRRHDGDAGENAARGARAATGRDPLGARRAEMRSRYADLARWDKAVKLANIRIEQG